MGTSRTIKGAALVDLVMAMMIVGVCLMVTMQQLAISYKGHQQGTEKLFTYQKAMAIYAELQVAVEQGEITNGEQLDAQTDATPNPVLTTRDDNGTSLAPDHPMSGNLRLSDGSWKWYRKVELHPVQGNPTMRYAQIRMLRRTAGGQLLTDASAGGLLNLPSAGAPAVKEYDVYVLAIAAAPSLWMPLPSLRSLIEAESASLAQDNPNLKFRLHWITKLGYGRDQVYTPRLNENNSADQIGPFAYWYPGKLAAGSSSSELYSAAAFDGRLITENGVQNGYDATENPLPHAVADQWNHCMRTPAARELFEQRVAAGLDNADEPPLQLLLADMEHYPTKYRNAIIVNLHGEGLPCPPLRNYSDAARSSANHPGVRVVTHPSKLRTPRDPNGDGNHADTEDVELRVYAYHTNPATAQAAPVLGEAVTLQIMGVNLTGGQLTVEHLHGGVDTATGTASMGSGVGKYLPFAPAPLSNEPHATYAMHYEMGYVAGAEPHTWIRLHNTPVFCGAEISGKVNGGMGPAYQLYGMQYLPSAVGPAQDHGTDLATYASVEKNTARWRIRILNTPLASWLSRDRRLTVKTRIGTDVTTGRRWPSAHDPQNESVTYTWWAASQQAVPLTERFQFIGDPRHNPYADVAQAHGYNWFFDDLRNGSNDATAMWPGLDATRLRDGFGPGGVSVDVPRLMQVWRDALQASGSVFTHANGRFANYVLLGGEIPGPTAINGALFGGTGVTTIDTMSAGSGLESISLEQTTSLAPSASSTPTTAVQRGRMVITNADRSNFIKPWIGELAPDHSSYRNTGNLRCGSASNEFRYVPRSMCKLEGLPAGTVFYFPTGSELGDLGPATLLQGDPNKRFQHVSQAAGNLLGLNARGREILDAAGLRNLPDMPGRFPYRMDIGLATEPPHTAFTTTYPPHQLASLEVLSKDASNARGAGVLRLASPDASRAAWFVVATDTPGSAAEHRILADKALLWGIRGFHTAGAENHITQVPQVQVTLPLPAVELQNPTNMQLAWRTPFKRFDGIQPFTGTYPSGYEGDESRLVYVVTYSHGGAPFRFVDTHEPATLGQLPEHSSLFAFDAGHGDEMQLIDLPAEDFPAGAYVFRVECFDTERRCHSTHHEVNVRLRR